MTWLDVIKQLDLRSYDLETDNFTTRLRRNLQFAYGALARVLNSRSFVVNVKKHHAS